MVKVAEVGVDTSSGVEKVPLFQSGDSGAETHEMVKVETLNGGTTFIPAIEPAYARYPYLKVQTANHGVLALHNAIEEIVDDFEDGDKITKSLEWNGWQGDTGSLTVADNGRFNSEPSGNVDSGGTIYTDRGENVKRNLHFKHEWAADFNEAGVTSVNCTVWDSGGTNRIVTIEVDHGDNNIYANGTQLGSSTFGSEQLFRLVFDYDANDVEVFHTNSESVSNLSSIGTVSFANAVSGLGRIELSSDTESGGNHTEEFYDDIKTF